MPILIYYRIEIIRKGGITIFEFLSYPHIWIALSVIFLIIEAFTLGLTTIWFAAGALIAMIAALVGLSVTWQILIFLVSSFIIIYFTRPFVKKMLKVGKEKTNAQSLIGEIGIVTEDIRPLETGLVKVSGQTWTAKCKTKETIEYNTRVRILGIEGVKLIVERLDQEAD